MSNIRLRWPVYRVYSDEEGLFVGIWFHWPIYRHRTFRIQDDLSEHFREWVEQITDISLKWPDVTPRS